MAEPYDRFTERARAVLARSEEAARSFNHNYIGTEHLLLGLADVEDGLAAKVLLEFKVTPERVRIAILYIIGKGNALSHDAIGLTPRAKTSLDLAWEEAKSLDHPYIGTEHILLGLMREGEGIAAGVLESLGVKLAAAREAILQLLLQGTASPEPAGVGQLIAQWMEREKSLKRYNLALPEELFAEVQALADRQQTTVVELLRRFVKLGLLATAVQERPDAALLIREGEREREVILL